MGERELAMWESELAQAPTKPILAEPVPKDVPKPTSDLPVNKSPKPAPGVGAPRRPAIRFRSAPHIPRGEEALGSGGSQRISPMDRGRGAREFYLRIPRPALEAVSLAQGRQGGGDRRACRHFSGRMKEPRKVRPPTAPVGTPWWDTPYKDLEPGDVMAGRIRESESAIEESFESVGRRAVEREKTFRRFRRQRQRKRVYTYSRARCGSHHSCERKNARG